MRSLLILLFFWGTIFSSHAETIVNFSGLVLPLKSDVKFDGNILRRSLVFSEGKVVEDRVLSNLEADEFLTDLPGSFFRESGYCSLKMAYFFDAILPMNEISLEQFSLPKSKVSLVERSVVLESFSQYRKPVENWLDVNERNAIKPMKRFAFDARLSAVGSPIVAFELDSFIQGRYAKLRFTNFSCSFPFFKDEAINDNLIEQLIYSALGITKK